MSLTGLVFLLAFFTGIGLAIARHPVYGLYTYVAVFYLHPPSRWWGETLPDLRWAMFAAVVTLAVSLRLPQQPERPGWATTTPGKVLIVFTGWFVVQNLWALDPESHWEATTLFLKYVMLFYLVYRLVQTPEDAMRFLLVHLAGCAYFGWLAYSSDAGGRLEGVGGPGVDEANAFAMQMGTGAMAGAMFALAFPGWRRWFAILSLPFVLNGVVLSGSRGGFLAVLCGGVALWYLKPVRFTKLFYAFAALGVVLFGMLASDFFWQRIGTLNAAARVDEQQMDTSALSRLELVRAQTQMFIEHPWGTGHRGTAVLSPDYLDDRFLSDTAGAGRRRASHNTFMTALSEQGLPGAICFAWIWGWVLLSAIRLKRAGPAMASTDFEAGRAAVIGGLIVVLVAGVFVDYIKTEIQVWLWALLAVLLQAVDTQRHAAAPAPAPAVPARAPAVSARTRSTGPMDGR